MTRRTTLLLAATAALLIAAAYLLPVATWTIALAERARGTGALGVALFFVAYIVATVAAVPGSILTLAAGFVYGPVWGLAVVSPASVMGATAAFLLGRSLLRDWAERQAAGSTRVRAIRRAVSREGFKIVTLLRLSPLIPFNLLNYMLSLTSIRLGTYVAASAVGMLPATALYVYLGSLATTAAQLSDAGSNGGSGRIVLYGIGLVATVAVVVIVTRTARRALESELARGE